MLVFLAFCMLSQVEPTKVKDLTAAEYVTHCEEVKGKFIERETERIEFQIKANRGRGPIVLRYKKYLTALKAVAKDDSQLPQIPLDLDSLDQGEIGYPQFTFLGETHNGFEGAKVLQVLEGNKILCTCGDKLFLVTGMKTENLVDDDPIALPGMWRVSGRYAYQTTQGAKKTVLVISPWKGETEFNKLLEERRKKLAEEKEAKKKATKKPANKS